MPLRPIVVCLSARSTCGRLYLAHCRIVTADVQAEAGLPLPAIIIREMEQVF